MAPFVYDDLPMLSIDDVFALDPYDEAGDAVMEWMQDMGFRGCEIARVMQSLDEERFPTLFLKEPSGREIEVAVDAILNGSPKLSSEGIIPDGSLDSAVALDASLIDNDYVKTVDVVASAVRAYGCYETVRPGNMPTDCCHTEAGLTMPDGNPLPDGDASRGDSLLWCALASFDDVKRIQTVPLPHGLPGPKGERVEVAGGLVAVAPTRALANLASRVCLVAGRNRPQVRPFIWWVDRDGKWWAPGDIPIFVLSGCRSDRYDKRGNRYRARLLDEVVERRILGSHGGGDAIG